MLVMICMSVNLQGVAICYIKLNVTDVHAWMLQLKIIWFICINFDLMNNLLLFNFIGIIKKSLFDDFQTWFFLTIVDIPAILSAHTTIAVFTAAHVLWTGTVTGAHALLTLRYAE